MTAGLAAAALGVSLLPPAAAGTTTGTAAPTAPTTPTADCPAAVPPGELAVGQRLDGSTVSRGSAPEAFTATVVGVLADGIAPGVDMVLVEVDSPAIQAAGGVWSGMSGSPLRTTDGRLVGAVSYGLSGGPSTIAGVTPAAAMYDLLAAPAAPARSVALSRTLQQRVLATGEATAQQAGAGMRALGVPLAVSGLSSARLASSAGKLTERLPGTRPFLAGTTAPADPAATAAAAATVVPGGNVALALSYGQFGAAAVGTVTALCDDQVLAFGHPFQWAGRTTQAMHAAQALYVQPDSLGAPFKVANVGPLVGTGTQDRLAGVRGTLGPVPAAVPVRSTVTSLDDGRTRTGTTHVVTPDFVPTATLFHVLGSLDAAADRVGTGVVRLGTTVRGHRADGRPWSVELADVHATGDATIEAALGAAVVLDELVGNRWEDVTVDEVAVTGTTSEDFRQLTVVGVQHRTAAGTWVTASPQAPARLVAGERAQLRALLRPHRSTATVAVPVSVVVPAGTVGTSGGLQVSGGAGWSGGFDEEGYYGPFEDPQGPDSFDELLAEVRDHPRADSVSADLFLEPAWPSCEDEEECEELPDVEPEPVLAAGTARTADAATGSVEVPVEVVAPAPRRAGAVTGSSWALRAGLAGGATTSFGFGLGTDRVLTGDWDGNGTRTPGVFRGGAWFLRDAATGEDRPAFRYGNRTDEPVVGDWDGDGDDEVGVYRAGRWLLRGTATPGAPEHDVVHGDAAQRPVVGDWDGDGDDEPATYAGGTWRLRADLAPASRTSRFAYGTAGDLPLAGDWDRDGQDGVGVWRAGAWALRDAPGAGPADLRFSYGPRTSRPVVG